MEKRMLDQFKVRTQLGEKKDAPRIYSLKKLAETVGFRLEDMPYSVRVLLESLVRNCDGKIIR